MEIYLERLVNVLDFHPIGAHVDGSTISSVTLLTVPTGATKIRIQALTQNVRYTLDGSLPSTTRGFQLASGAAPIVILVDGNTSIKVIQEAATADLQYQWGY
jgi:hypothetical protein